MKINKEKILELHKSLTLVSSLPGAKFSYAVARNIDKIHPEVQAIVETQVKTFADYEKERKELAISHAIKVDGNPKVENGSYVVENQEKFNEDYLKLREKYQSVNDEFESFLKEEVEIDLHMIQPTSLPDSITAEQINGIILMIEEDKK